MTTKENRIRQIRTLACLAEADGVLSGDEVSFIKRLSALYGISEEELDEILASGHPVEDVGHLSKEEKFDYVYSIIYLAKIDGRVYEEEIAACVRVGKRLGLGGYALYCLLSYVKAHDEDMEKEKHYIKALIANHPGGISA